MLASAPASSSGETSDESPSHIIRLSLMMWFASSMTKTPRALAAFSRSAASHLSERTESRTTFRLPDAWSSFHDGCSRPCCTPSSSSAVVGLVWNRRHRPSRSPSFLFVSKVHTSARGSYPIIVRA